MKMGIKEIRERLGEVARGREAVQLTDRGRVIGTYTPLPRMSDEQRARAIEALDELGRVQAEWRDRGINTEEWLAEMGLDPWGTPLRLDDR